MTENNNEKKGAEQPAANTGEGNIPKELNKIERAELVAKRMEEAEKRLDEKIAKLTELQADRLLGSTAGGRVETQPKVETPAEYAKRISQGKL